MSEPERVARFHSLRARIVTSPAPPEPSPDPRPQPSASRELGPNFSQPPLLSGASESFSPRTFSFDLGRRRVLLVEVGLLLLGEAGSTLPWPGAFPALWERACGGVLRTGVRGSAARCSLHPSLGAAALALPIPAFPRSAERHGGWGSRQGCPRNRTE